MNQPWDIILLLKVQKNLFKHEIHLCENIVTWQKVRDGMWILVNLVIAILTIAI